MTLVNRSAAERVVQIAPDDVFPATVSGENHEAPQPPVLHPTGETAPPLETIYAMRTLEAGFADALASGDVGTLMTLLANRIRHASETTAEVGMNADTVMRRTHLDQQVAAYHKAAEDQQAAATWGIVAKIGAYVGAAVSVAVGVCGAAFSGGVSLAGGIALAVVCVTAAASVSLMAATDLHAFGEQGPPKWMGIAVAIMALIGTVCSAGAGAGGLLGVIGGVGGVVSVAAQTATIVTDIAVDTHAIQEPPSWLRTTLAIASAAGAAASVASSAGSVSAAAGAGTSAARDASQAATATANAVGQSGRALALGTQAVGQGVSSVYTFAADTHTADAKTHRRAIDRLHDDTEDLLEGLRQAVASVRRSIQRASGTVSEEGRARSAITRNFARA